MIQEQCKSIFQHIIFRSKRRIDELSIHFSSLAETIAGIVYLRQFPIGFQAIRIYSFELFQLLNSQCRTGRLISLCILQISLLTIRVKIDGLLIKLASLPYIFLCKSNITLQHRYLGIFIIGFLRHCQVFLSFGKLPGIQINMGYGSYKIHILFVFPFQQFPYFFRSLCRICLNQAFHFIYPSLPFRYRRLCGKCAGQQQRSHTKN